MEPENPEAESAFRNESLNELKHALGTLVVSFGALEESLHDAIWVLSDIRSSTVNVLTAGLQFRTLTEKFGALCKEVGTARCSHADVQAFCNHLDKLNERRNSFIHSAWDVNGRKGAPRRGRRSAKPGSGFSLSIIEASPTDVLALATDCEQADVKLWEIVP